MAHNDSTLRYIMGIQCFANIDSGACLLRYSADGEILDYVAISEERLIRKKYPYTFPVQSLMHDVPAARDVALGVVVG